MQTVSVIYMYIITLGALKYSRRITCIRMTTQQYQVIIASGSKGRNILKLQEPTRNTMVVKSYTLISWIFVRAHKLLNEVYMVSVVSFTCYFLDCLSLWSNSRYLSTTKLVDHYCSLYKTEISTTFSLTTLGQCMLNL